MILLSMSNIDYHGNDLHSQIVRVIGESIINDVLEMTIRFVVGMIHLEMNEVNILVNFLHEKSDVRLIFRYRCGQYTPILNATDKANHIDDFFNSYFDEIRHEYVEGENKLIFRFTMMSDVEMKKKYLDALDKKRSREGGV